jgi:hypothetical protein
VVKAIVEDEERRPGLRRLVRHDTLGGVRYFEPPS